MRRDVQGGRASVCPRKGDDKGSEVDEVMGRGARGEVEVFAFQGRVLFTERTVGRRLSSWPPATAIGQLKAGAPVYGCSVGCGRLGNGCPLHSFDN